MFRGLGVGVHGPGFRALGFRGLGDLLIYKALLEIHMSYSPYGDRCASDALKSISITRYSHYYDGQKQSVLKVEESPIRVMLLRSYMAS